MKQIPAGEFKTHCLTVMDEVQATGQPVVVTKHGKPVVKLVPAKTKDTASLDTWWGKPRSLVTSSRP